MNEQKGADLPKIEITKVVNGARSVICLGEQIATLRFSRGEGWSVHGVVPPFSALRDVNRNTIRLRVAELEDRIREMLADGRLPYGEALAAAKLASWQLANERAARLGERDRIDRLMGLAGVLHSALVAAFYGEPSWRKQAELALAACRGDQNTGEIAARDRKRALLVAADATYLLADFDAGKDWNS